MDAARFDPLTGEPFPLPGHSVDADPRRRPGVPRERPPATAPGVHEESIATQEAGRGALARTGARRWTPVFGTAAPSRGVPRWLRRAAYRLPERRPASWLLLVAADRVEALEWRARGSWPLLVALAAALLGYALASRAVRRA